MVQYITQPQHITGTIDTICAGTIALHQYHGVVHIQPTLGIQRFCLRRHYSLVWAQLYCSYVTTEFDAVYQLDQCHHQCFNQESTLNRGLLHSSVVQFPALLIPSTYRLQAIGARDETKSSAETPLHVLAHREPVYMYMCTRVAITHAIVHSVATRGLQITVYYLAICYVQLPFLCTQPTAAAFQQRWNSLYMSRVQATITKGITQSLTRPDCSRPFCLDQFDHR